MKTLVVGHITHDYYGDEVVAGGCAFYGARVHAALAEQAKREDGANLSVHLVAVAGDDFGCAHEVADLDLTLHQAGETTVFANYYPTDKPRVQLLKALAGPVLPKMVPPEWMQADLIHLAPVLGEIDLETWKTAIREVNPDALIAINIQGWIKRAGPLFKGDDFPGARRVVQEYWGVVAEDFRGVDIACLSEEDVIGQPGLLEKLTEAVPLVAFTRGELGSQIFVYGEPVEVGIYPTEASDPTGAGDVFAASFAHRVALGEDMIAAARFAAAAASIVVEGRGARALSRIDEAVARAEQVPADALDLGEEDYGDDDDDDYDEFEFCGEVHDD
ncbi:PfkB family carbohydrate kinase [Bradymonas sediminis]|uniref:Carbohydrate kinase PfkB domain-containing protein n=1 Tax=Bradymonas sediminis TaxID=1548548 RepID=A0A2Z4FQP6_9DELT|nr:PfkB family carbohydrate kinase [Bradymonas sediminis]AWV90974.1 hypothetical protein DN745_17230 [Bradymonas sediminis]TDP75287.1 sugar/nucleoside kinase (ribokinase family) [Bradymonas sediminis]